jgi:hypothetical protein
MNFFLQRRKELKALQGIISLLAEEGTKRQHFLYKQKN